MKFIKLFFICTFLFFTLMSYNIFRFGYGLNDGLWRTLMTPFEGTVWSPGFSEKAFSKIKINMTSTELGSLLGEPLRKDCGENNCFWIYTWQDSGTADFDQRWVVLNKENRVIEVRKSFFID